MCLCHVDPNKDLSAPVIVSEIGTDMSRFPSAAHLISWACVCPRSDESAGKRRSNRQRKGANWLKTTLVQCVLAAAKKKGSYLEAQFYRLKARRGPNKAIIAVVASILTAIYHMLGTMYQDLDCDHSKRHSIHQQKKRLVKRLSELGYAVELKPLAARACGTARVVCGPVLPDISIRLVPRLDQGPQSRQHRGAAGAERDWNR